MKRSSQLTLVPLLLIMVALVFTACQTKKAGAPALPQEFEATLVPSVPLDAYMFVRQGQDTSISGEGISSSGNLTIRSVQAWLTPSGGKEVAGVRILFASPQDAQKALDAVKSNNPKLWKKIVASSLFIVYGEAEAAKNLISAIEENKFSKLETNSPDGWAKVKNLPFTAPGEVVATGFVNFSETLQSYAKANVDASTWSQIEPVISQAKIDGVAIAGYLETPIDPAQIKSVDDIKAHKLAVLVTGESGYPGFLLSLGMKMMGPRIGLTEESLSGGSAFKRTLIVPHILERSFVLPHVLEKSGLTAHLLLGAAGNQVYVTAALDESLNKKLLESALAQ